MYLMKTFCWLELTNLVIVYLSCALSSPDLSHDLVHALSAMMHPDPSLRWVVGLHSVVYPHVGGGEY